jgi:hypothetical protein
MYVCMMYCIFNVSVVTSCHYGHEIQYKDQRDHETLLQQSTTIYLYPSYDVGLVTDSDWVLKEASSSQHTYFERSQQTTAPAHYFALILMERLFSPCTRMRDILQSHGVCNRKLLRRPGLRKLLRELNLDVSTEEFLSADKAFTYANMYTMLKNVDTVLWLTPHAFVVRAAWIGVYRYSWEDLDGSRHVYFNVDGKDIVALARSPEHLLEISDVVKRLLAASTVDSVLISKWKSRDTAFINAPTVACLMEQCHSLKVLALEDIHLDENHCRMLGAYSRPGLEVKLHLCKFTNAGARALAAVLGRNQGPTELTWCYIDNSILADGLRRNSRLKSLTQRISRNVEVGNHELLAIAAALKENEGLVDLDLPHSFTMSDEAWDAVCDSLKTHPTLQKLRLLPLWRLELGVTPAVLKFQTQALVDMLKVSTSIHTILWDSRYSEKKILQGTVIPHLETNKLRPRLLAIQNIRPIAYRAKVLGRALLSARTNANSFWILLSGNPEVACSSTTTPVGTNLAAPATIGGANATTFANATTTAAAAVTAAAAATVATTPDASTTRRTRRGLFSCR